MKAIVIREYGGPEVLVLEEYAHPIVGPGEVLVRVAAASINPVDTLERSGQTKAYRPVAFPAILGWDVSGEIVELGAGVRGFSLGDWVLAWAYHTYAELCTVKAELLVKVPQGIDLVDAAALPLVTMTGSQLISVGAGVKKGQSVLVSGAVGGVGRAAVFMAKERGAIVIAGVRKKHLDSARDLGAHQVVALDDEDEMNALPAVDIVANTVRGATAEQLLGKVKSGGVFASATGAPANVAANPSVRVISFVSKQDTKTLSDMAEAVRDRRLTIPVDQRLPLKNAREGHAALERGGVGKILLLP